MKLQDRAQSEPASAHSQPVDPPIHNLEAHGLAQPPHVEQLRAAASEDLFPEQHRLQDVLPEIYQLAQKVGGMKQLADVVATLSQARE